MTFFIPAVNLPGVAEVAHLPIAQGIADAGQFDLNYLSGMVGHDMGDGVAGDPVRQVENAQIG